MDVLKEKQKIRLDILQALYELSGGDTHDFISALDLIKRCSITDEKAFTVAVAYLEGERLLDPKRVAGGLPAFIRITHEGVLEVERAFSKPDDATEHFPPVNVLYVNNMIGSAIQQGTVNSVQNSEITNDVSSVENLREFVEKATKFLSSVDKQNSMWQEVIAEVNTLQAQSTSPKPKTSIIRESLSTVASLCEGAAAGAIGTQLATYIPPLLAMF